MLVFLPILVEQTGLGYSQWAQLFALGMGTYVLGSICWPLCLPRWGHRYPMVLGLAGYGISMLLFAWILWLQSRGMINQEWAYLGFAGSRLLYGVFASALLPITQSWSAELSAADQRLQAFSRISMQLALSRALGPVLAGLLGWLHWLLLPLVLAVWPLLLLIRLSRVPDPVTATTETRWTSSLKGMVPPLWLGLIALTTTAFASSLQFQLSPALTHLTQQPAETVSLILAGLMVTAALVGVMAHRLQSKWPPPSPQLRIMWIAALLAVGALALLEANSLWQFAWIVLSMSLGLAWLTPVYSTQLSLRHNRQHLVAAQLSLAHISGHLVGLTVTALALEQSLHCAYIWLAMLGFVIAVAGLSLHSTMGMRAKAVPQTRLGNVE